VIRALDYGCANDFIGERQARMRLEDAQSVFASSEQTMAYWNCRNACYLYSGRVLSALSLFIQISPMRFSTAGNRPPAVDSFYITESPD
jgi:hypothetical protein